MITEIICQRAFVIGSNVCEMSQSVSR